MGALDDRGDEKSRQRLDAMQLELLSRKLTGKRSEFLAEAPLSEDDYMDRKADAIDRSLRDALNRLTEAEWDACTRAGNLFYDISDTTLGSSKSYRALN